MAHTTRDKEKLLNRVRRIRGQVEAIERALTEERDCGEIMHLLAACRGAIGSLTAEVLEGHVRSHIVDPDGDSKRARAAQELIEVLKTYVR
ncbi:metal/formaldehyde-sensitive transcriptional repressor [Pendulispora albinea]|uniref:Metal/formaldehyde-sensitive transcriptional repressor n=1 Tax=Pendulispora albinea TaxID=2741071 RepID=A0ABZ2M1N7_9BACT